MGDVREKGLGPELHGDAGGDDQLDSKNKKAGRGQLGWVYLRGRIIAASPPELWPNAILRLPTVSSAEAASATEQPDDGKGGR